MRSINAHLEVDRAHYAPMSPYHDSPQPIGHAATISAPHMHASAVKHLLPLLLSGSSASPSRPGLRVLDIGSGSGYLTHVLAELTGAGSAAPSAGGPLVVGVEHIPALRDLGESNMRKSVGGRAMLDGGAVRFVLGDGRVGWSESGSGGDEWDVIHVGASAVRLHDELVRQLRAPGRMFIPVNDDEDDGDGLGGQHIWTVDKDAEGRVTKKRLFGVRYVPLTNAPAS